MFRARFHDIDPRRLDAGMTKQVSQLRDIFFDVVERPREQMAQVVRNTFRADTLARSHSALNSFQTVTRQRGLPLRDRKTGPLWMRCFWHHFCSRWPEFFWKQDVPAFALAADTGFAAADALGGDILQFGYADAGGADGFEQQLGALVAVCLAAVSRRKYSARESSRPGSAKILRWRFKGLALPAGLSMDSW